MHRLKWSPFRSRSQEDSPDLLIAAARLFLASASLVAIWIDTTEPVFLATISRDLLLFYVAYSAAVFIFEQTAQKSARYVLLIHACDVLWAAAITSVTEGPNSPFFLFFLFALIAAAYRWDMTRVMLTAASLMAVLGAQATVLKMPAVHALLGADYDTNRFIMRAAYLLAGSIVIGYIGDNEKRLIREAAFIGSLVSVPRAELGLKRSAQMVLCEIARFFRAPQAAMLIRIQDGNSFLLELGNRSGEDNWTDLSREQAEPWLFSIAADCAWVMRNGTGRNLLDPAACWRSRKSRGEVRLPLAFVEHCGFQDLLLAKLLVDDQWSGRIFLFNPQPSTDPVSALNLLDRIVRQVTPAVHNVYLLRRIRERAQAVQRQHLAHELHDGAIQALVGALLQLEAFHRKHVLPNEAVPELRRTQDVLRSEIFNLRMIMQDLYARSIEQPDFAAHLSEMVNDFRRSTNIQVELLWNPNSMKLRGAIVREALRIIQEALLNIRRHSSAKRVTIQLNDSDSQLQVTVVDDGVGLGFDGRLQLGDLDELHVGPSVIKHRLHELGGSLIIESHPGAGSRLEMTIPLERRDASVLAD